VKGGGAKAFVKAGDGLDIRTFEVKADRQPGVEVHVPVNEKKHGAAFPAFFVHGRSEIIMETPVLTHQGCGNQISVAVFDAADHSGIPVQEDGNQLVQGWSVFAASQNPGTCTFIEFQKIQKLGHGDVGSKPEAVERCFFQVSPGIFGIFFLDLGIGGTQV
jgi:hypothetical protein